MKAFGMLISDIGISALDAPRKVRTDEKIEDSIDAVRCDPTPFGLRNRFRDIVSTCRLFKSRERVEYRGPHVGPLLALLGQALARCRSYRFAPVELVVVA